MERDALLMLSRSFMECRIFLTAAELNVFSLLQGTSLSISDCIKRTGWAERPLTILLDALAGMDLLVKERDTYQCSPEIAEALVDDSELSVLPMVLHHNHLWDSWSKLTEIVRGEYLPAGGVEPWTDERLKAFIGAMHVVGKPVAAEIVRAVHTQSARMLLDVGGASGTYTIEFLKAMPEMKATLFDRHEVIPMARERLAKAELLDRVQFVSGDFYCDSLPTGHDLAFVSAIIHQNSPAQNVDLYRKIFEALLPGGRIVIRDHILDPSRTKPRAASVFAVNMLAATQGGNCYTFDEIECGLHQAGFHKVGLIQYGERMDGLIVAYKP